MFIKSLIDTFVFPLMRKLSYIFLGSIVLLALASCDVSTEIDTDDFSQRRFIYLSDNGFSISLI